MAEYCSNCGIKLGFMGRISGRTLCDQCKEEYRRLQEQAKAQYPQVLRSMWQQSTLEEDGRRQLQMLSTQAKLSEKEETAIIADAFRSFAEEVLVDDILTEFEEQRLLRIGSFLGITQQKLQSDYRDILFRLVVARVNDGRLPTIVQPKVILKKGESAHLETEVLLLKEVAITEYQGGYSGFSFRIVKGVRYHVGGVRGRRVVVGTELKEDDRGIFSVTSHRTVFLGSRKTMEIPYSRLVSMEIFDDGVRFHLSNRQKAPLFKMESGHTVAAVVNAAMQRLEQKQN